MNKVTTVDLLFQDTPGTIAAYIFDTGDGLAVVDIGPSSTLRHLEEDLSRAGAALSDIRHVLLTHIHFDHAGAAGTVLERVKGARAYVHERGAAHLISPEKLVASATQIYGDNMKRLWGEMRPIDPERLSVLAGGETFKLGQTEIRALYTPGHAVHHLAYQAGDELFTGDVGGIRLMEQQTPRAPTPPPDINLEDWRASIQTLRALDSRTLHVTHFGSYANTPEHWDGLVRTMELDAERIRQSLLAGKDFEWISARFSEELLGELEQENADLPARYEFACPPWMSVQGLMRYWKRQETRTGQG